MKLFGITFGERKTEGGSRAEILAALAGLQSGSKSGANVTHKTAAEVGAAIACARVIAEGLSQVPFKLYREQPNGGRQVASDHPLHHRLAGKPNALQTSFEFREQLALHLVFCGNAYVFKSRLRGKLIELLPFEPQRVTVKRNRWQLAYEIALENGERITIPAEDMWHLRGPSWDGVLGLDAVKYAREAIGLALATEEHNARMFSNGARVGGILSSEGSLKEDQVKLLRESWERTQGGVSNAFKTAILWGGLKWSPMAMPNDEAQMMEQRRFQVEEICRHFRVMPIMVGYSDKTATYASAEQMFLAHVVHTLGPWYARLEQSADANLLTDAERAAGYYFKFVSAGLMRGAHADRAAYYSKALGAGGSPAWMTQDEVRALEEMNPMGGAAASLPVPTSTAPTEPVADAAAAKTAEAIVELKSLAQTVIAGMTARPEPVINVTLPEIKAGDTHVTLPEIKTGDTHVTLPEIKAGDTNITLPEGLVQLEAVLPEVKAGDVIINVPPAPEEVTMHVASLPVRETRSTIERDAAGNITKSTQTERDA